MWYSPRLYSHLFFKRKTRFKTCFTMVTTLSQDCANWRSRLFAVDANIAMGYPRPIYFASTDSGHQLCSVTTQELPMLAPGSSAHSVCITTPLRVSAARLHQSLGQELTRAVQGRCQVLRLFSYLPEDLSGSVERGFFVVDPESCASVHAKLETLLREYMRDIRFCSYRATTGGEIWQSLWDLNEPAKEIDKSQVVRVTAPSLSPMVINIKRSAVFYKLDDACSVLQECSLVIPEATYILNLLEKKAKPKGNFPVIVIEGLDATGKSTLTESLKVSLKAALLKSPPDCIAQWRKTFDDEPSLLRRAYYALGNYIGAAGIAEASQRSPVIVDRYWHSTAAYSIATEIGGGMDNLPEIHHDVYQWPGDLLKPDLVILLTVCDEERILRMRKRGLAETMEEKELAANSMFRQKVEESYKRMENPGCVVVDASAPKEAVLKKVLSVIYKHCALSP
ncbi:UMP-CMP kinase 2, mitochondrial [Pelodytes ibericus]